MNYFQKKDIGTLNTSKDRHISYSESGKDIFSDLHAENLWVLKQFYGEDAIEQLRTHPLSKGNR